MPLAKYVRISMFCLAATLAFAACAKKNNDLAARRNAAGATATRPAATDAADQQAAQLGYVTEFVKINPPTSSGSGLSVISRISVNNNYYDVTTVHNSYGANSQPATASQNIGGANFVVSAVCGNEYCNPYYIMVNITAGATQIKQMAMMKFFYAATGSENDIFYSRSAGQFLTMPQAITELSQGVQQ